MIMNPCNRMINDPNEIRTGFNDSIMKTGEIEGARKEHESQSREESAKCNESGRRENLYKTEQGRDGMLVLSAAISLQQRG